MFVNCSNHKSDIWSEKQLKAAEEYGAVVDVPFPNVAPGASKEEILELAHNVVNSIMSYNPTIVMCQGEFTLTYAIVRKLAEMGIKVVAACSERKAVEQVNEDGTCERKSIFEFVQFREYV